MSDSSALLALDEHFATLEDPRVERTKLHLLLSISTIALCAVICGAESWDDIAKFGEAKEAWLKSFLDLPYGIPTQVIVVDGKTVGGSRDHANGNAAIHRLGLGER